MVRRRLILVFALPGAMAIAAFCPAPLAAQATTRVFAWGDSITYGYYDGTSSGTDCAAGYPTNDPPEQCGYPGRLDARLNDTAKFSPSYDIQVINLGKGGETTSEALSRIDRAIWPCPCDELGAPCKPNSVKYWYCNGTLALHDLFVVMEGTNDITNKISAESIAANLQSLGDKAETFGLNVVISRITPRHPDAGLKIATNTYDCTSNGDTRVDNLNAEINTLATTNGWPKVDPFGRLKAADISGLFTNYYQDWDPMRCDGDVDAFGDDPVGHPNRYGFDAIACNGTKTTACTTSGSSYPKTFEYVVRGALPPRLTLTPPTAPIVSGVSRQFSLALPDVATFAQTVDLTWDFGDGTVETQSASTSPVVRNHTYWLAGNFNVTVTAEHANGGSRASTTALSVTVGTKVFADGFESGDTTSWSPAV